MSRMIKANMFRLRKSRLFKWVIFLTMLVTALITLKSCLSIKGDTDEYALETYSLSGAPYVQIAIAAVIVLFLGTDHSQNTIRNKITVGGMRRDIYTANLMVGIVIGLSINTAWLVGGLSGMPVLGAWKMPLYQAFTYLVISMLCAVSVSALAALVGTLVRRKSSAVAVTVTAFIALLFFASDLCARLNHQQEIMSASIVNGEIVFSLDKDPKYTDGIWRAVCEIAVHTLPQGTSIMLSNCNLDNPWADAVGALFVTVYASAIGACMFRKKDIN